MTEQNHIEHERHLELEDQLLAGEEQLRRRSALRLKLKELELEAYGQLHDARLRMALTLSRVAYDGLRELYDWDVTRTHHSSGLAAKFESPALALVVETELEELGLYHPARSKWSMLDASGRHIARNYSSWEELEKTRARYKGYNEIYSSADSIEAEIFEVFA